MCLSRWQVKFQCYEKTHHSSSNCFSHKFAHSCYESPHHSSYNYFSPTNAHSCYATKAPTIAHPNASPTKLPTPATSNRTASVTNHKAKTSAFPFYYVFGAIGGVSVLIAGTVLYRYNRYNYSDRVSDEDDMSFTEFVMTPSEWFG